MQNLNNGENVSSRDRLSQSMVVRSHNENLADTVNKKTTNVVTTNTNVVQVDYIGAEYQHGKDKGFAKRMPKGYNGSKANPKKKGGKGGSGLDGGGDGTDGRGGSGIGRQGDGNGNGKDGDGDGDDADKRDPRLKPGNKLTDEQIKQIMQDDPEAAKFLEGIIPEDGDGDNNGQPKFQSVVVNEVKDKMIIKARTTKKKMPADAYKWPYYDSYVPGLGMNDKDKRIVRRGIQRQYFPNDQGNFNMDELHKRKKGIKNIEHQYMERIKSASSPSRRAQANQSHSVTRIVKYNNGLFKANLNGSQMKSPMKPGLTIDASIRYPNTTGKDGEVVLGDDTEYGVNEQSR